MYKRDTEIRHITSADIFKLGQILEQTNSWKKLMRIIPRNISSSTNNEIKIDDNLKKYNNDHIRLIENASIKQNRMSTEILFEEWGTSGKKRPTVGNLLELLIEAELFRAADFVALNFLNEPPPERPAAGPAAKIDITLPLLTEDINDVEKILNDTDYPGTETLLENAQISSNMNNKDFYQKVIFDDKKLTSNTTNNMTIIMTKQMTGSVIVPTVQESDFIKFSSKNIHENNTITTISENNMPILSELVCSTTVNDNDTHKKLFEFPLSASSKLPQVIMNVFGEGVMKVETSKESNENHHSHNSENYETNIDDEMKSNIKDIPMLSVLQYHDNEVDDDNYILPHLSVLNGEGVDHNNDDDDDENNDMDIIDEEVICNDNGVAGGDTYDFNDITNSTTSSSSCCLSNDSNITPNSSVSNEDQSSCLNDSSLTTVTETSDDSSFSCDGNKQQQQQQEIKQSQQERNEKSEYISSDSNIPCLSALDN